MDKAIFLKFGLDLKDGEKEIKIIDNRILVDEQCQLMSNPPIEWTETKNIEPLGVNIEYWTPRKAEREFLKRFKELNEL